MSYMPGLKQQTHKTREMTWSLKIFNGLLTVTPAALSELSAMVEAECLSHD
jgi:hypothetical protein